MSLVFTLLSVCLVVGVLYVQSFNEKRSLSSTHWDDLVETLAEVPIGGITRIALDYLQPGKGRLDIQTDEMWSLVGGAEGLRRMQANADILVRLAAFAERWNRQESIIVGERMRREGLILQQAVRKIQRRRLLGFRRITGPFCVQEAACSYFLMRHRLLALYETSHVGRYGRLSIALGNAMAAYGPAI